MSHRQTCQRCHNSVRRGLGSKPVDGLG